MRTMSTLTPMIRDRMSPLNSAELGVTPPPPLVADDATIESLIAATKRRKRIDEPDTFHPRRLVGLLTHCET